MNEEKKNKRSLFLFVKKTEYFITSIALSTLLSVAGILMTSKGTDKMLFWVQMKRELGIEDALYCIKNINKYMLMKNVGIVFVILGVIAIILLTALKLINKSDRKGN